MDPINIPPMLAYIPYMDPMGNDRYPLVMASIAIEHGDRNSGFSH